MVHPGARAVFKGKVAVADRQIGPTGHAVGNAAIGLPGERQATGAGIEVERHVELAVRDVDPSGHATDCVKIDRIDLEGAPVRQRERMIGCLYIGIELIVGGGIECHHAHSGNSIEVAPVTLQQRIAAGE